MTAVWNLIMAPLTAVRSLPAWLAGLSLAARIAWCVALFQVFVVLLAVMVIVVGDDRQVLAAWLEPGKLLVIGVLLAGTPWLVYWTARLWLERDVSRFPDILEAWTEGLAALSRQGVSLGDVPLYLVFGARSREEEERLLGEAPCEFLVTAAPTGDAALHVYGGPEAVFVCLSSCSRLGDLVRHGERATASSASTTSAVPQPAVASDDVRGTVMVGPDSAPSAATAPPPVFPAQAAAGVMHTIDIAAAGVSPVVSPAQSTETMQGRDEMRERLAYLCSLLRQARPGMAALNGSLFVVPGDLLMRGRLDPQAVGQAAGDDLTAILMATGVRAPVVVLVAGLEHERGFQELIARMPAAERSGRLGNRFPAGLVPSYDQLGILASRACGMVEDLILGRMFRSASILATPHNPRLAMLMARLRTELAGRLTIILRRALLAPDGETGDRASFLAGCYLAACGDTAETRGFVRGVIDRMLDCQGDLEWTAREAAADDRAGRQARTLWIISGVVFAIVGIVLLRRLWAG